jgi:hypothetical protein
MTAKRELILSEASREMMPETLRASDYYVGNDQSVQEEFALKQEIAEFAKGFEPWEVEIAKRSARGESQHAVGKAIGKRHSTVVEALRKPALEQLIHYFVHLAIVQDGPNRLLRRNMLWRIAVDNEKTDPKESIKALAEMNRMEQGLRQTGGFTVVINGVDLSKRGAIDG